ncbi:UvrD-helicase domain-containing protein [Roseivirga pacifica]|uniref:UvrD-helicase domain-containing protein n=1 Tax=Roseivirga pacifica TaxID=1267423 RepID=UPI00227A1AEF|nr:ATP-dependent helicase [Roseivirga pacifica]
MKFKPTQYQIEIFQEIQFGKSNLVINAVAGSGKTTTILKSIDLIRGRSKRKIVFLAFNRRISLELKRQLPSSISVSTMHAMGLHCIQKENDGKRPEVDIYNQKLRRQLSELSRQVDWVKQEKFESYDGYRVRVKNYVNELVPLMDLCKLYLATEKDSIASIAQRHNFNSLGDEDFLRLEFAFKTLYENPDLTYISLADMIFYPALGIVPINKYDFVFVDECQDLNKCQQRCVELMIEDGGRFVAVGDPKQAIYGFQGSDIKAFESFTKKPNTKPLKLSDCFRCSRIIVEFAQTLNPTIQASNKAQDGVVRYGSYREAQPGDFVLCRLNAPLVSLCIKYLKQNIQASITDSELDSALKKLIKTHSNQTCTISDLFSSLHAFIEGLKTALIEKGLSDEEIERNSEIQSYNDKLSVIQVLSVGCSKPLDIIRKIESIFSEDTDGILLSSIHKSKGLEADRVFILGDELMPLKKAELKWEREQEENLMYVAYTRAKTELIFINDIDDYTEPGYGGLKRSERLDSFLGSNLLNT